MKLATDVEWEIEQIMSAIAYYAEALQDAVTSSEVIQYQEQIRSLKKQLRELQEYL